MKAVLKAQLYSLRYEPIIGYFTLLMTGITVLLFTNCFGLFAEENETAKSGSMILADSSVFLAIFGLIFAVVTVGFLWWNAFATRDTMASLSVGYSRTQIYFGTTAGCIIVAMIGAMIVFSALPLIYTILFGYGHQVALMDVIKIVSVYIVVLLRMMAEMILLMVVVRKLYIVLVLVLGFLMASDYFYQFANYANDICFAMPTVIKSMNLLDWTISHIGVEEEYVYAFALTTKEYAQVISVNIMIAVACIIVGWAYFRKADL